MYTYSCVRALYCRVDRDKTGASGPRGGCARDFVNFRKKIHASRARRGRAGLTVYPPRVQIRDVASSIARPDHRKSKFKLRHDIKLIELYVDIHHDEVRILIFDDQAEL